MVFRAVLLSTILFLRHASSYATLSDDTLNHIPAAGDDFDIQNGALLSPILQVRVPGTAGSAAVLKHFVDFFSKELPAWDLSFQNTTMMTPAFKDPVPFNNLILKRDPPWATPGEIGRLTLVAHYDSLMTPEGFIGATDSAAPCAMLMHAARVLDGALTRKWDAMQASGADKSGEAARGVQILLLDGEEAFVSWTDEDSIYGARSLAAHWEDALHPAMSTYHNSLSDISLFVLLDLLGAKNPKVPSYFETTHWAYQGMSKLETRLRSMKLFRSSPNHPDRQRDREEERRKKGREIKPRQEVQEPLFLPDTDKALENFRPAFIGDDHVPFMARGVEVLHIIPSPFPRVWHTMEDDGPHLDLNVVEDWTKLVIAFAGEYMELEGFFEPLRKSYNERDVPTGDKSEFHTVHPVL